MLSHCTLRFAALLLLMPLMLAGCNVLGAAAYVAAGPTPTPAQYVPAQRPTLVWAENFAAPGSQMETEQVARYVAETLKARQVVPLADVEPLLLLKSDHPARFRALTIPELGRQANAEQVIYIHLSQFMLDAPTASGTVRGKATAKVKLVDAVQGQVLWPTDRQEGYEIYAETPMMSLSPNVTDASVRQALAQALGQGVARLFFEFRPE